MCDVLVDLLKIHAPMVAGMSDVAIFEALQVAQSYAPACLPANKQQEAVVYYAAYLLSLKQQADAVGFVQAGVTQQKEGDLSRSYGNNGVSVSDPYGYLAKWQELDNLCKRLGAITVGSGGYRGCC